MKINELVGNFHIFMTNEEKELITKLSEPRHLKSFPEHEQFVIENLIRKGLIVKIGHLNPTVIANELD